MNDRVPGQLDPIPALITIHRVVTTRNDANMTAAFLEQGLEFGQKTERNAGTGIATVGNHMQLRHDTVLTAEPNQCVQVIEVAVHAAVGDQAHQVQRTAGGCRDPDRIEQRGIFEEAAVLDRVIDAYQILLDDRTAADGKCIPRHR